MITLPEPFGNKLIFPFNKFDLTALEYKPFTRFTIAKSFDDLSNKKLSKLLNEIIKDRATGCFIIKPKNISPVEYNYNSFNKLNNEKKNKIIKILKDVKLGWFEPPKFGEKTIFFGIHGGSNWYGSTTNPKTNQLFTPINHIPYEAMLYGTDISKDIPSILKNYNLYLKNCSSCHGEKRNIKIERKKKTKKR